MKIEGLVIFGIVLVAMYRVFVWLKDVELTPDPWGPDVQAGLEAPEALPVCHDCLAPQDHIGWFCPECGAAVGKYCNYLPGVYIFSVGEAFRSAVTERFRLNWLTAVGYMAASFHVLSCLAAICWIFLFKNIFEKQRELQSAATNGMEPL